jgi:prolyl oligopeptidase
MLLRLRGPFVVLVSCLSVTSFGCGGASAPAAPNPPPPQSTQGSTDGGPQSATVDDADFLFLEDIQGAKALEFARAHNAVSESALSSAPGFRALEARLSSIYASKEKIPSPYVENGAVRNFWTDAEHPRGLWRQTTLAEYRKPQPAWTVLLDIDALNKAENESFVFHGAECLHPAYKKCLVSLSKGGGDASIVREFDVDKKAFVKNGFVLPEGKHAYGWKDENTIYVGTDFGPGSLTRSGYARVAKEWKRGTPLADAVKVFEVQETDIGAACWRDWDHGHRRDVCQRKIDFEHRELFLREGDKLVRVEKPADADAGLWDNSLLLRLRSEWAVNGTTYEKGSLLVTDLKAFMAGKRDFQVLFAPTKTTSLAYWTGTKNHLLINVLSDVKNRVTVFSRPSANAAWVGKPLEESVGAIHISPFDLDRSDDVWLSLEDFTVPSSLELWNATTNKREPMKKLPSFFEAANLEVTQHFAASKDGTKVPYFEVGKKGRGEAGPTLVEAYGGFEIPLTPGYRAGVGAAWIERGGTYVLANLRGGGEYGPAWHEAAMKHNRQNAYDDLAAVAQDLVRRGVATTKTLGVMGGSNGGLLTSVMLTQRPELFGAIVSKVPLTDMKRYHKLLAGASWMSEYGDPENPEDWAALARFSPFQNVKKDAVYPPAFYTTSTKDDRVHPGHARKMVAKLEALGHKPLYYENIEGGHGGSADIKQRAYVDALVYTFLATRLGLK